MTPRHRRARIVAGEPAIYGAFALSSRWTADPPTGAVATLAFDHIFANEIVLARTAFRIQADTTPFHLLGLGMCISLGAPLGMDGEAARLQL
ncbi:hypothetical protein B0H12DRAFT_1321464 [Mycena haematopus]|nr:hypothetical protein B0H12DRAFT_1321464 [Mycena haematopus]